MKNDAASFIAATPAAHQTEHAFADAARDAIYHTIFSRRDVRGQFLPDPVPEDMLSRILTAAHFAPSVGYMQPWSFVLVRDQAVKNQIHSAFRQANEEAGNMFEGEQQAIYKELKLEGIREAPINLLITCDRDRAGPVVIGRTHIKAMDLYSSVCAVQNLWLAARAEGLGVGWVSIFHQQALRDTLNLPARVIPVAYLCIGKVSHFLAKPELESAGWRQRLPLADLVYADRWETPVEDSLRQQLAKHQAEAQAKRRL